MNRLSRLGACLLLTGLACCGPRASETLTSADGRFAIDLPGKPQEARGSVNTAGGKRRLSSFHLSFLDQGDMANLAQRLRGDPLSYSVSYIVLSDGDQDLEGVVREAANRVPEDVGIAWSDGRAKPRITSQKPIQLGASRGLELMVAEANGAMRRVRIFALQGRCYNLEVFGNRAQVESAAADRFFDSFRLLDAEGP